MKQKKTDAHAAGMDGPTRALFDALMAAKKLSSEGSDETRAAIASGADVHARIMSGETPLMIAAARGLYRPVKLLIEAGADVNAFASRSGYVIHYAASGNCPKIIRLLVSHGAHLEQTDIINGYTPLQNAVWFEKRESVRTLIALGAVADGHTAETMSPLAIASQSDNSGIMKMLIAAGADINQKDKDGFTVLHRAVFSHNATMTHLLLELGAVPDIRDSGGYTSLMTAVNTKDTETVQTLLRYGADPDKKDTDGSPVLRYALLQKSPALVKLLIEYGADINAEDETGMTPLIEAVTNKQFSIVRLLVEHGARLDETDAQSGFTALAVALAGNDARTARFLMRSGARDVPAKKMRANMVMMAAVNDRSDIVRHYLAGGTDVNAVCVQGFTALIIAAQSNALRSAAVLLKTGADPNIQDDSGATALSYAETHGFTEMEKLLRTYGAHAILSSRKC